MTAERLAEPYVRLRNALQGVHEIARRPINQFETTLDRLAAIERLSRTVLDATGGSPT